ncbi:MAG: ribosome silencing factor [Treponema sp.]|nr:ribosome silencing factor [Treponema sp.]
MDDTLHTENSTTAFTASTESPDFALAVDLGKLLADHKGGEVLVMDMRELSSWTDFFVIATVTSTTHLMGLQRHIKDFASERGAGIMYRSRRSKNSPHMQMQSQSNVDEWSLLDFGNVVVHLMSANARSFFELERLWSAAPIIYRAGQTEPGQ